MKFSWMRRIPQHLLVRISLLVNRQREQISLKQQEIYLQFCEMCRSGLKVGALSGHRGGTSVGLQEIFHSTHLIVRAI